jgi:hypothetical protein
MTTRNSGRNSTFTKWDSSVSDLPKLEKGDIDEAFWQKLNMAANNSVALTAEDASRIVALLKQEELAETESRIVSLIMNKLKGVEDAIDEGFLRYLSENYNNLTSSYRHDSANTSPYVSRPNPSGSLDDNDNVSRNLFMENSRDNNVKYHT